MLQLAHPKVAMPKPGALQKVKTPLQWVSWIWWWGSCNAETLGNKEYPFIAIAPRFTLAQSGSTW